MVKEVGRIPLFPLNTLVCPGGKLPLRIFETRYIDMVTRCLKHSSGFAVVMLRSGGEVDKGSSGHDESSTEAPEQERVRFYHIGTFTHIIDFDRGDNGLLNIVTQGEYRVEISRAERDLNGLWWGVCKRAENEPKVPLSEEYEELSSVLQALVQHPMVSALNLDIDYKDSSQVGWRLTELLPMENDEKQFLFELLDPVYRLEKLSDKLSEMAS